VDVTEAVQILRQTPGTLRSMLGGLSDPWLDTGGPDDWGPYDILGHLIEGEETDWVPRVRTILEHGTGRPFAPFDRDARPEARPVGELLETFARLRERSLDALAAMDLDLDARGTHPDLGEVTLGQLVATWAVHDLSHLAQAAEVMARRWRDEIGPWRAYLPVVDREPLRD